MSPWVLRHCDKYFFIIFSRLLDITTNCFIAEITPLISNENNVSNHSCQ